jgi:Fe-S-cluster containining protein
MEKLPGRTLKTTDRFLFHCHPDFECFNRCCRNLNLFLYPYDVIRLKQHLEVTSDHFLDRYVDVVLRPGNFFPDVLLKMADCNQQRCPFLSGSGCSVYDNRPYSCRLFPVEQGALYDADRNKTEMVHFFRPPDFCLGQKEAYPWTPETWIDDQEAETYAEMTTDWSALKRLFVENPWGTEGPNGPKGKMAFMAVYNIDRFREFVLKSSFLKRYRVKSTIRKKIRINDVELLKFGFGWIKFFIWGIHTPYIKQH